MNDPSELHWRTVELARMARDEDLGSGDITSALLDSTETAEFHVVARQRGVFCGRAIAGDILGVYGDSIALDWSDAAVDGARIGEDDVPLGSLRGPCKDLLAAERVFLNFLQRLCGIATLTRAYVDAVAGTGAAIYDTRKTTPGWRLLEKYAVRCGGGHNHRMGLYDAVLIKDNHLAGVPTGRLAGFVFDMLNAAGALGSKPAFIEVEADTLEQFEALLAVVGIDVILLDNFRLADLRRAAEIRNGHGLKGKVALEASGGITLENVREIARTGVEQISVGALTHSAAALDLSLVR